MDATPLTLQQLNQRIAGLLNVASTQNVWVVAELSDVNVSGGHCYMELLQKDQQKGTTIARARAAIWANNWSRIRAGFKAATGQDFATGIKVMVCASVSYHPVYGLSLVINNVNPEYTIGDLVRRRREILLRLQSEGLLSLNKQLKMPEPALRIAIVSSKSAAGYGDFLNQLYANTLHLRFTTRLFPAMMQGERTPSSIMAALDTIEAEADDWDCVVIIRGGGATSDLVAFDDYELAAHVARFPLPVVVGIGHERDVTVLDYLANIRVKTPTAAAEWLISQGEHAVELLRSLGGELLQSLTDRIAGCRTQLAYFEGLLPTGAFSAIERASSLLQNRTTVLASVGARRIEPQLVRLSHMSDMLCNSSAAIIERQRLKMDGKEALITALSPEATLRRGYSVTRVNGIAVRDASLLSPGTKLETEFASGVIVSVTE
jgi:exodeoxyribonuclease VII large subunit